MLSLRPFGGELAGAPFVACTRVEAAPAMGIMGGLVALSLAAASVATALAVAGTVARARPDLPRRE